MMHTKLCLCKLSDASGPCARLWPWSGHRRATVWLYVIVATHGKVCTLQALKLPSSDVLCYAAAVTIGRKTRDMTLVVTRGVTLSESRMCRIKRYKPSLNKAPH